MKKFMLLVLVACFSLGGCKIKEEDDAPHHMKLHVVVRDLQTGKLHKATMTLPSNNMEGDYELVTGSK